MAPDSAENAVVNVVIGTAGHIDHGKSSLVHRLTGKHPSRLREEIERGMTIDIGFSEWKITDTLTAGFIDVPGHEKFVRNMVAGAAGVDLALLVIAADDGIMQQTREHVQIMRLLGIKRGITVVTKVDAVESEMVDLVVEEIREYLVGTFLESAPIMKVSNITGEGIEALQDAVKVALTEIPRRSDGGIFRMPINRSFSVKGHGTVVTGVPTSGKVSIGDDLEILPRGSEVRVRGIHVHHEPAQEARAGHRVALNVTDVNWKEVQRGDVIATRGYFAASRLLEARFEYLDHFEAPMENNLDVRVHTGTAEVGGHIVILDKKSILPGETALVQLRLEEPVVVAAGDRYIARLASPVMTLGGGTIVGETKWRFKRFREWVNENIVQKEAHLDDPMGYLEFVVRSLGTSPATVEDIAKNVKGDVDDTRRRLLELAKSGDVVAIDRERLWLHQDMFLRAMNETSAALLELHKVERLKAGFQNTQLVKSTKLREELVDAVILRLAEKKKVEVLQDRLVRHREWTGGLSAEDYRLVTKIADLHAAEFFGAPILSELTAALAKPEKKVKELLNYLFQMGQLIPLNADLALHQKAVAHAERLLIDRIKTSGPMPSAEFKDIINASRKYVIPLLEYFDKKGITRRDGNVRHLAAGWEGRIFTDGAPT